MCFSLEQAAGFQLEEKLLKQERDNLNVGESPKDAKTKTYTFKKEKVQSRMHSKTDFQQLNLAIEELENESDLLSNEIKRAQQTILEHASVDNFIEISAKVPDPDTMTFRTLEVKIDGHYVYQVDEATQLWLRTENLPLYLGPLQPGDHKIEYGARIVTRDQGKLPFNNDSYKVIKEVFKLTVPPGKVRKKWAIVIDPKSKGLKPKLVEQ